MTKVRILRPERPKLHRIALNPITKQKYFSAFSTLETLETHFFLSVRLLCNEITLQLSYLQCDVLECCGNFPYEEVI